MGNEMQYDTGTFVVTSDEVGLGLFRQDGDERMR